MTPYVNFRRLPVQLTERQIERLRALGQVTYKSMSQLVREAVDKYLDEEERKGGLTDRRPFGSGAGALNTTGGNSDDRGPGD